MRIVPLVSLAILASLYGASASAQHQHSGAPLDPNHGPSHGASAGPYAGLQQRDIKALSAEQLADLREGRGMGASLPAELNGVPGPLHVLQLRERLGVTPEQAASLDRVTATMKASAQALGVQVIEAERELDRAFQSPDVDEQRVRDLSRRIGALNAELRSVHLLAHLQTRRLLTDGQVLAYNEARGYAAAAAEKPRHRN